MRYKFDTLCQHCGKHMLTFAHSPLLESPTTTYKCPYCGKITTSDICGWLGKHPAELY